MSAPLILKLKEKIDKLIPNEDISNYKRIKVFYIEGYKI